MCISSPSIPAPPPLPPPPPEPPKLADENVRRSRREQQTKQRNLKGAGSTFKTGPRGLMAPANTASTGAFGLN